MKKDPTPESLAKAFHAFGAAITEDGPVVRAMQRIMFDALQLDERAATLTQQQGGEQEAGVLVGRWRRLASYEDEEGELEVGSESAVRLIRCADELEAALRSKQPAASEGDGCPCNGTGRIGMRLPNGDYEDDTWACADYPACQQANTSKQATGAGWSEGGLSGKVPIGPFVGGCGGAGSDASQVVVLHAGQGTVSVKDVAGEGTTGKEVAVVAEYLAARDAYEQATNPSSQWSLPRRLGHGHPIALRIQAARAALRALVPKEKP